MSNVIDMQGRKMNASGFVQLPFDFVEAIAKAKLTQRETQVLWAVIRKTWGWNKEADVVAGSQLAALTGLTRQRCAEALSSLMQKGVLVRRGGCRSAISIEQDASRWTIKEGYTNDPKLGSVNKPTKTGSVTPIQGHSVTPKAVHTTDKTYKKNNTPSEYGDLAAEQPTPEPTPHTPDSGVSTAPRRTKPKAETAPVQDIIDLYHTCLPMLPVVRKLTDKRVQLIRARWNDTYLSSAEPGVTKTCNSLTFWRDLFDYVAQSDFLTGKLQPTAGRSKPFQADLEWLLNESNLAKILEGKYHG